MVNEAELLDDLSEVQLVLHLRCVAQMVSHYWDELADPAFQDDEPRTAVRLAKLVPPHFLHDFVQAQGPVL